MLFCVAKAKTQRTKAFLRVLKYSNGGVLEVISFSSEKLFFSMHFASVFVCVFLLLPRFSVHIP